MCCLQFKIYDYTASHGARQQYDKQCAINTRKIKELADEHNEYPVLLSLPFDSCLMVLTLVVQSDELPQPPKSVPPTPVPTNISVAGPFEIFKTRATMQTINAHPVP